MPRTSKAPYLGRLKLFWCKTDNLPLLDQAVCPKCKNPTIKMQLTPPGDIRPAFDKDLSRIRSTIDITYGEGLGQLLFPNNTIYLINRSSGIDLSEEIYANGFLYGRFIYNILRERFEFHPHQIGAKLLVQYAFQHSIPLKRCITMYAGSVPFIKEGKSILAPGIKTFDFSIEKGDFCIVRDENEYLTMGIANVDGHEITEMVEKGYGKVAKNLRNQRSSVPFEEIQSCLKPQTWENVFEANKIHMNSIVREAQSFIESTIQDHAYVTTRAVAYSGGKDSLCTLLLVFDTIGSSFEIFFADTGIELPETIQNTREVAKVLGMEHKVHIKCAYDKLWDLANHLGPPGRDYRFCCHGLKAQRINEIIESVAPGQKVLSFLGQRRYESFSRAAEKRVYVNSFIPQQIAATPIKNWNALEVWLYILYYPHMINGKPTPIPVNKLYYQEFERIGCYLCPASDLASLHILRDIHPEMMKKWDGWLQNYAQQCRYPQEWLKFGLWRFRKLDPQWKKYFEKQGIEYSSFGFDPFPMIRIDKTGDFTPLSGEILLPFAITAVEPLLTVLPGSKYVQHDSLSIRNSQFEFRLYHTGKFSLLSNQKPKRIEKFLQQIVGLILKSQNCANCGVCEDICPQHIIHIEKRDTTYVPIIRSSSDIPCIHCSKCLSHCPLYQKIRRS